MKPIVSKNSRVLILGTFPGPQSLCVGEYYAHPRNAFWRILADILIFDVNLAYKERVSKLKENGIAVWDVLESCERVGAADRNIVHPVPNDFEQLFRKNKEINKVVFNGKKAHQLFRRLVSPNLNLNHVDFHPCPSTSPANTRMNFDLKRASWLQALTN